MTKTFAVFLPLLLSTFAAPFAQAASPGPLVTHKYLVESGRFAVRVGVQAPTSGRITADILYLHGFGDRLDNHGPLFDSWNRAGLRVISFDLPSHGENSGFKNHIDLWGFSELADLAHTVLALTRDSTAPERPLLLSGWSTGGLLAVRMAQTNSFDNQPRKPKGLILFAPAVAPRTLVGEHGVITEATLTSNPTPPHRGPIAPKSPLLHPIFASKLLFNAACSFTDSLPRELPVLTLVAGDTEDQYVETPRVKDWALKQRADGLVPMVGLQCPGALHELDNEPGLVGPQAREVTALFARAAIRGLAPAELDLSALGGPCLPF